MWVGDTANFSISSNKLAVSNNAGSIIGWKDAVGADQEAYVTLSTIQSLGGTISLGLKAQDSTQCNNLQVRYLPSSSKVQVFACSSGTATQQGADISVSFAAGDKFGARAKSNGTVEVYRNGTLVGSVTVSGSWPYLALGGKIGLGASNASGTIFDDFGGGSLPTPPAASSETYGYDTIGNLTSKNLVGSPVVSYTYSNPGQPRPHTPSAVAGVNRTYDANGNLTGGDSRTYAWNSDNKPSSVAGVDNATEQYGYDADTNRVYRSRNGITTFYLGQWEEDSTGVKKQYYSFGGSTVAMRDSSTNAVTYLHSDHLGSVSLTTTSNGNIASQQYFDPWGKVKTGGIGQTSLNYTGQRLDGTGLLYYNARYYDPALGKFLTPDNVADGLNRYAYVHNNPITGTDPTGHYEEDVYTGSDDSYVDQDTDPNKTWYRGGKGTSPSDFKPSKVDGKLSVSSKTDGTEMAGGSSTFDDNTLDKGGLEVIADGGQPISDLQGNPITDENGDSIGNYPDGHGSLVPKKDSDGVRVWGPNDKQKLSNAAKGKDINDGINQSSLLDSVTELAAGLGVAVAVTTIGIFLTFSG